MGGRGGSWGVRRGEECECAHAKRFSNCLLVHRDNEWSDVASGTYV